MRNFPPILAAVVLLIAAPAARSCDAALGLCAPAAYSVPQYQAIPFQLAVPAYAPAKVYAPAVQLVPAKVYAPAVQFQAPAKVYAPPAVQFQAPVYAPGSGRSTFRQRTTIRQESGFGPGGRGRGVIGALFDRR